MKPKIIIAALLVAGLFAAPGTGHAMDAHSFYVKGLALKKKGMGAMFSKDMKPVMREAKKAGKAVKAENDRAKAAGKPLFCPPKKSSMNAQDMLNELARIPKTQRSNMTVTQAFRRILIRRYPC